MGTVEPRRRRWIGLAAVLVVAVTGAVLLGRGDSNPPPDQVIPVITACGWHDQDGPGRGLTLYADVQLIRADETPFEYGTDWDMTTARAPEGVPDRPRWRGDRAMIPVAARGPVNVGVVFFERDAVGGGAGTAVAIGTWPVWAGVEGYDPVGRVAVPIRGGHSSIRSLDCSIQRWSQPAPPDHPPVVDSQAAPIGEPWQGIQTWP